MRRSRWSCSRKFAESASSASARWPAWRGLGPPAWRRPRVTEEPAPPFCGTSARDTCAVRWIAPTAGCISACPTKLIHEDSTWLQVTAEVSMVVCGRTEAACRPRLARHLNQVTIRYEVAQAPQVLGRRTGNQNLGTTPVQCRCAAASFRAQYSALSFESGFFGS